MLWGYVVNTLLTVNAYNHMFKYIEWLNPQIAVHVSTLTLQWYNITVLLQIMAQAFISFQQLFTPATKRDWRLYETGDYTRLAFISWSSESKFFRLWILMEAGNTHAADPVDTVRHVMDSTVCSHRFYKSV